MLIMLIICTMVFASCGETIAQIAEDAGISRGPMESNKDTDESESQGGPEYGPDDIIGPVTRLSWTKNDDGTYSYYFPPRNTSGMATISEMETASRERFDDQANDWYIGETIRDEATGIVTYSWDRSASTLATLEKYGAIYRGDEESKVVYFTFDCGYEIGNMPAILDTLKEKKVPATFFVNGHYVKSASEQIERMLAEGHIVANHATNHYDMTTVSVELFVEEVQGLEELYVERFPDAPPMRYFRPPSGNCSEWVLKMAEKMGYKTVLWSWAYYDWNVNDQMPIADAMAKIKRGLHNGCVYMLHPESSTNTTMLGQMIDYIRSQGYEILPLCAAES